MTLASRRPSMKATSSMLSAASRARLATACRKLCIEGITPCAIATGRPASSSSWRPERLGCRPGASPRRFVSGASRDRTGDLLLAKQIGLSTRVSLCPEKPCKSHCSVGHGRTRQDGARQSDAPLVHPQRGVRLGGGEQGSRRRRARLRQLVEVAAPSRAALASPIAVCASSRGISSNSSITCP